MLKKKLSEDFTSILAEIGQIFDGLEVRSLKICDFTAKDKPSHESVSLKP